MNGPFNDTYSGEENYLTQTDPRVKLVFVFLALIIILISGRSFPSAAVIVFSLMIFCRIKIPLKVILLRLLPACGFALLIITVRMFSNGVTPFIKINIGGLGLTGYREGLQEGMLSGLKIMGAGSLIILLGVTTPLNKLAGAMCLFGVPRIWVEIMLLTYRYIFVFREEVKTIRDAQEIRLGYSSVSRSLRSLGKLAGLALVKTYDQSAATGEAMMVRGYNGIIADIPRAFSLNRRDILAIGLGLLFLVLIVII